MSKPEVVAIAFPSEAFEGAEGVGLNDYTSRVGVTCPTELIRLTDHERLQAEAERLQSARAADKARIKFLEGLQSKLAPFALEIMRAANQGASFDGWEIQDTARKHGLMTHHEVSEPCGEGCACAEFEFPGECYRIDAALSQQGKEGET
jgi:hypothetical protein